MPQAPLAARAPSRLRARIIWGLVALAVAACLARLGLWQLSRAHEKTAQTARVVERHGLPPLATAEVERLAADDESVWERRVVLQGRWMPERTVWLMNRTMDESNGFFVLTPLRLDDGQVAMVQRGWVATDPGQSLRPPPLATPAGPVRVAGHLAPWPSHRIELGRPAPGPVRQNLDRTSFATETGLAPLALAVVEDTNGDNAGDGLARHWAQPATSPFTNYGYAVQWFAMSITVLVLHVWLLYLRRAPATPEAHAAPADPGRRAPTADR